jgi:hypothetical protein
MARFRGTVQGGRGQASRLGHKTTGLRVHANSWSGSVEVIMHAVGDEDHVVINVGKDYIIQTIYSGPVKELKDLADLWRRKDELRAFVALLDSAEKEK